MSVQNIAGVTYGVTNSVTYGSLIDTNPTPTANALLLEDGNYILLEDGSLILLENNT